MDWRRGKGAFCVPGVDAKLWSLNNSASCPATTVPNGACPADDFTSAPVAQLDRVPGYELGGREFESLRAHHFFIVETRRPTPASGTSGNMDAGGIAAMEASGATRSRGVMVLKTAGYSSVW